MVETDDWEGLKIELLIDGSRAREYGHVVSSGDTANVGDEDSPGGQMPTSSRRSRNHSVKVQTYVESISDAKLGFEISIGNTFSGLASCQGVKLLVYLDGIRLCESTIRMSTVQKWFQDQEDTTWVKRWDSVTRTEDGQRVALPLQFDQVTSDVHTEHPAAASVGKIETFLFAMDWVNKTRPTYQRPRRHFSTTVGNAKAMRCTKEARPTAVNQEVLNDTRATHALVFGKAMRLSSQAGTRHYDQGKGTRPSRESRTSVGVWKFMDPLKEPFLETIFKYRSYDALQALGFTPI